MKQRVGKILLFAAAAVLVLFAAALGGLSFYAGSDPVRQRIVSELQSALKMPVSLRSAAFTPWGGAVLKGVRITERPEQDAPVFLDTDEVRVKVRLLPLLRNEVVLQEIVVSSPKITGREGADGGLILPRLRETARPAPEPGKEPRPDKPPAPKRAAPQVKLGSLVVERAAMTLLDAQGKPRIALEGIALRGALRAEGVAAGTLRVDRAQIPGLPPAAFLQSPFTYTADGLELSDLSGNFAGGTLAGAASVGVEPPHLFRAKLKLMGVDLSQFSSKDDGGIGGRLMMELDAKGEASDPGTIRGRGTAEISQGKLAPTPLLQTLGILLEVPELVNIEVTQARSEFQLKGRDIRVETLSMDSENLRLTGSGSVKNFDKLSLGARLHVSPSLRERLPGDIARAFADPEDGGWMSLPFDVGGTVRSPKTNLQKKLLREAAKGAVGGLLNDLLGTGGDEKEPTGGKEPAPPEPPLPPGAQPSPAPPAGGPAAQQRAPPSASLDLQSACAAARRIRAVAYCPAAGWRSEPLSSSSSPAAAEGSARGAFLAASKARASQTPVRLSGQAAISSGGPAATILPPSSPPSGPRSITQSAVLITSRLCSMTTTVFPPSRSLSSTSSSV